jgi:hypothetical protein
LTAIFLFVIMATMADEGIATNGKRRVGLAISSHAVDRYRERVDRRASVAEARLALMQIAGCGRARPQPRHWLRRFVSSSPGLRFIIWSHRPDICLLAREGVVLTVFTRAMCPAVDRAHLSVVRSAPRPSAEERAAWRWSGYVDAEEAA